MTELLATYTFEGDEIFAIHEGSVIASGTDMEAVESDAVKYLDSLSETRAEDAKKKAKAKASHIITPNGVKGEILGRTPTVWGEQVTARFANGQITTFEVHGESNVQWVTEKKASAGNPAESLQSRLSADFDKDRESLARRHAELQEIAVEAIRLARQGAPYLVERDLDAVRTAAEYEARQVKEAIDHLDSADAEAFIPEAPFKTQIVEQADLGHSTDWLDITAQQMIEESEGQDLDKLISEGPATFVAEQDLGALADAGVTREMALSYVTAKTAGFQGEEVEEYREKFIARVEVARRRELADRKDNNHKEAAAAEEVQSNAPDSALFM
jgi:hypothetical protein